jgi:hypothetical protein
MAQNQENLPLEDNVLLNNQNDEMPPLKKRKLSPFIFSLMTGKYVCFVFY